MTLKGVVTPRDERPEVFFYVVDVKVIFLWKIKLYFLK